MTIKILKVLTVIVGLANLYFVFASIGVMYTDRSLASVILTVLHTLMTLLMIHTYSKLSEVE